MYGCSKTWLTFPTWCVGTSPLPVVFLNESGITCPVKKHRFLHVFHLHGHIHLSASIEMNVYSHCHWSLWFLFLWILYSLPCTRTLIRICARILFYLLVHNSVSKYLFWTKILILKRRCTFNNTLMIFDCLSPIQVALLTNINSNLKKHNVSFANIRPVRPCIWNKNTCFEMYVYFQRHVYWT